MKAKRRSITFLEVFTQDGASAGFVFIAKFYLTGLIKLIFLIVAVYMTINTLLECIIGKKVIK